jgi:hypothetical protein
MNKDYSVLIQVVAQIYFKSKLIPSHKLFHFYIFPYHIMRKRCKSG